MRPPLIAAQDAALRNGGFEAQSATPWLRVEIDPGTLAGRWVELTYASGFLEPLVRPILRCLAPDGVRDQLLPGAVFGRAIWAGVIPEGAREILISPTNRPGRFDFELLDLRLLSTPARIARILRKNPIDLANAVYAYASARPATGDRHMRRALKTTRLALYDSWRRARLREFDINGLDRPYRDWRSGPEVRFVVDGRAMESDAIARLIDGFSAQPYPNWSLILIGGFRDAVAPTASPPLTEGRAISVAREATVADLIADAPAGVFLAPLAARDESPVYALPVLAEAIARRPETALFFGDDDFLRADGKRAAPRFRPRLSHAASDAAADLGPALFFNGSSLGLVDGRGSAADFVASPIAAAGRILAAQGAIEHIRRVLRTRAVAAPRAAARRPADRPAERPFALARGVLAATIIIPTRDQPGLLRRCVESVQRHTPPGGVEIVVIDNGGERPDTRVYLNELARDAHIRVLARPGPFNYAALCNDAATTAVSDTLVFLNDDTEVLSEKWLAALLRWSSRPDVGAVGAKLLYPNGLVQHAGIVLGVNGRAAHFERLVRADEPGYFGRLLAPHEFSAVTAACLAVERRKFDAIGGFDAEHLPVDLNDVDLCLRLSEQGWRNILAADCVLIHHELKSRGADLADTRYEKETAYFRARWIDRLRDDPYFHPALSLETFRAALG